MRSLSAVERLSQRYYQLSKKKSPRPCSNKRIFLERTHIALSVSSAFFGSRYHYDCIAKHNWRAGPRSQSHRLSVDTATKSLAKKSCLGVHMAREDQPTTKTSDIPQRGHFLTGGRLFGKADGIAR